MFDLQATQKWTVGVLKDPVPTAQAYKEANPPWVNTFVQLPLTLYVAAAIVAAILGLLIGGPFFTVGATIYGLVVALIGTFIIAFVLDFLCGFFDGEQDFNAAYGVVGLAIVPAALASAIASVPFGGLIGFIAFIYSLYLTYQFIPVMMTLPEANRVKHFVSTIIIVLIAMFILSAVLGAVFVGSAVSSSIANVEISADDEDDGWSIGDTDNSSSGDAIGGGMLGGLERQANIAEQAGQDRFDPPSNGRLTEEQVESYARVLAKTAGLRDRLSQKMENVDEDNPSLTDIFGGVGDLMRVGTAEMEVVKGAGGNWAEHQWVKSQIEVARVQQDINDDVAHNYELFLEYKDEIEQYE